MSDPRVPGEQLALLKREVRSRRPPAPIGPAETHPVARLAVDLPLAHLDRPFDYLVPSTLDAAAVPGARARVRFAGRDVDAFILERADDTEHVGELAPLRRVVSAEPVLHPQIVELARQIADRHAGTLADVLRLAVPPRHARVESERPRVTRAPSTPSVDDLAPAWAREQGGPGFLARLAAAGTPRAVWTALPGADWAVQLAATAAATLVGGRGSVLCVPDGRDVARLKAALDAVLGADASVVLTAGLGPAARYRAFLRVSRGQAQVVVGTRAAAFAPVRDLGLVAIWDDGDDSHAEPRAPYPHAREVLLLRAHLEGAAALVGSYHRSVEAQALVEAGWSTELVASRADVRAHAPVVHLTGETGREGDRDAAAGSARVPRRVFEVVRAALERGPVLVSTPRAGYQPTLACDRCREPAHCPRCSGPLGRAFAGGPPRCRLCGDEADAWSCPRCAATRLRAPVVGALRTAEEWGRSFPRVSVARSGGDHVLDAVDDRPSIVVATPGAEPVAAGGYAAAVILDTWLTLSRPDLRAAEEALRRWINAAALVRPGPEGGRVIAVGDPDGAALQALVRWDPAGFASRELAARRSARLMPAARIATLRGPPAAVAEALDALRLPDYVDVLGPVEVGDDTARVVLRAPRERGAALSRALAQVQAARSARKLPALRVEVDPAELS